MGIEIEHKFLVTSDEWRALGTPIPLRQGFLSLKGGPRVRVRTAAGKGFLTIKGKSEDGISRAEYEYEIPLADADEMLDSLAIAPIIRKARTRIGHKGHVVEVDEFFDDNAGLVVAEIELQRIDEPFEKPSWLGKDVTLLHRYANASLVTYPFSRWTDDEKAGL